MLWENKLLIYYNVILSLRTSLKWMPVYIRYEGGWGKGFKLVQSAVTVVETPS